MEFLQIDLLALVERDTQLKKAAGTHGGEYKGACPVCGGKDRFSVNPNKQPKGVWHCRHCGVGGDAITYLAHVHGMDFKTACSRAFSIRRFWLFSFLAACLNNAIIQFMNSDLKAFEPLSFDSQRLKIGDSNGTAPLYITVQNITVQNDILSLSLGHCALPVKTKICLGITNTSLVSTSFSLIMALSTIARPFTIIEGAGFSFPSLEVNP